MSQPIEHAAPQSLYDLTLPCLREAVGAAVSPVHARTLWRALYRDTTVTLDDRADFLPPLQRWVRENVGDGKRFTIELPEQLEDVKSSDGQTRKFLLRLRDGQTVETVIMGYPGRFTACVSTQAGCAMGCAFCATGQMGFVRHLRPGEIVAQVLHCQRVLQEESQPGLRNLVLMGMGEPLHNYDAVMTALDIISERSGINIGPSRISVSTVGVIPGILRMAQEKRPYHLAVSLHATTDAERHALIPASRRWPLVELLAACRAYSEAIGRRIFFGWTLIEGINDTPAQAERLAKLLTGIDAHVNLILLNPTHNFDASPASEAAAEQFKSILQNVGIPCTLRQRRGIDVAAGCGQLRGLKAG